MYTRKSLLDFIFFDCETKPKYESFDSLPDGLKKIWLKKYHLKGLEKEIEYRKKEIAIANLTGHDYTVDYKKIVIHDLPTVNDVYIKEAGLMPEFSEIYCISFGLFKSEVKELVPIINSYCEELEADTIQNFLTTLHHFKDLHLFGYNTNEFDIPFLLKRMWYNGFIENYPPQLRLKDAKPWTVKNQDHMVNYKAGSWTNVSLDLLCELYGTPSPKDEFDNSEFTTLLLSGKITRADAIKYCEKDVKALMQIVLKSSSDKSNYGG